MQNSLKVKVSMVKISVALDPAGHLSIGVSNLKASRKFYSELFREIGFREIASKEKSAAWVTREGFGFWIYQAHNPGRPYSPCAPGLQHFCFKATRKKEVDKLYKFLANRKARVLGKPSSHPEYSAKYYALYFLDPDGIKLEYAYY